MAAITKEIFIISIKKSFFIVEIIFFVDDKTYDKLIIEL